MSDTKEAEALAKDIQPRRIRPQQVCKPTPQIS